MMNENIETMMEYLASSVQNNEVTNVDKLTQAINELENFPMTFEILDSSRVGQILQSIRHSKQITTFTSERIRSLIKCWRQLLDAETSSVIPNQLKSNLSKTPVVKNGYTNGYIRDSQILQSIEPINGVNHNIVKVDEPTDVNFKYKRKSPELVTEKESSVVKENEPCVNEEQNRVRNTLNSSKVEEQPLSQKESQNIPQIGKPKLKSTKELLADFSNFIESDTKNKILMDKISQEDDEPISYFPQDFRMKELVQLSILQEEKSRSKRKSESLTLKRKRALSVTNEEGEETVTRRSKCDLLLEQFQQVCTDRPSVVLTQFVPWHNLKRGLQMHAPEVKQPLSKQKRLRTADGTQNPPPSDANVQPLSLDIINNLLESFEERAQKKQMVSDAIQRRKEQTMVVDNTKSLVEMSMKLKLKIPKVPIMKIRRRKIKRKKKKKPKMKMLKPKIKKPRKPRVRAVPPITNYLDDVPTLPPLPPDSPDTVYSTDKEARTPIEFTADNVAKLAYGTLEGYNCTKHTQNDQLLQLTAMYSNVIGQHYLHVFPWVDLPCSSRSTFPTDLDKTLQSITNLADFYS